ncbi:MAG: alpha/beta hydrolase [Chlamydiota bacterium]|nr:alpha/beta hydrolase [Chlamydiota bacterium]
MSISPAVESSLPLIEQSSNDLSGASTNEKKVKEGFRIKKAVRVAFIVLASTFGAVALGAAVATIITAAVVNPITPAIICATVALTSFVALTSLGALKAWEKITPHLPKFLRIPANYIQSTVCALISSVALGVIWPIDYTKKNVKPEDVDPTQPLIIGSHGFLGSGNNWMYMFGRLKEAGHKNLASINYGNAFVSIDTYADKMHNLIKGYTENPELKAKLNGKKLKVQFLCHSMGGLVARHYKQKYPNDNVDVEDIITLGTPLDGTHMSNLALGVSKAAREMNHNSKFIKNQQKNAELDSDTNYYHIASKCDFVIRPLVSATLGKGPKTKVDWLDGTGHVSYLWSDTAGDLIVNYLKNRSGELASAA